MRAIFSMTLSCDPIPYKFRAYGIIKYCKTYFHNLHQILVLAFGSEKFLPVWPLFNFASFWHKMNLKLEWIYNQIQDKKIFGKYKINGTEIFPWEDKKDRANILCYYFIIKILPLFTGTEKHLNNQEYTILWSHIMMANMSSSAMWYVTQIKLFIF